MDQETVLYEISDALFSKEGQFIPYWEVLGPQIAAEAGRQSDQVHAAGAVLRPSTGRAVRVHDGVMCTDATPAHHARHQVFHETEPPVVFDLEPVDSVTVTTLMDNVTDVFMPIRGPRTGRP